MAEEKKDGETVKKVGTIAYAAYEDAATFDWTQVTVWPLCRVLRVSCVCVCGRCAACCVWHVLSAIPFP